MKAPVIAVPTSVGYGASFEGVAPLLAMLNSCAPGVGVVNIDKGTGVGVPLGLTVLATRFRVIGSVTLVDLDFLNESDPNSRYQRRIDNFGRQVCVDLDFGLVVSEFRCSGGLNLVRSYQADLGIMPAEFLFVPCTPPHGSTLC